VAGSQSTKVGLILATNRPADLDEAVLDRMDELLEFGLPGAAERQRIFSQHLSMYLRPPASGLFGAKGTEVRPEGVGLHGGCIG
jgi:ATPase family AAA domain-containing protein 3A/B